MSLLSMAVFDTTQNKRSWMTEATLKSLAATVNFDRHRLYVIDNASCDETKRLYEKAKDWLPFVLFENSENRGTSRAINRGWMERRADDIGCVKIDNDVVIHESGWLDVLDECILREPMIGIIALKRKDLGQSSYEPIGSVLHTELVDLPHVRGQTWRTIEITKEAIGTCCLFNSKLLDKIGFLYQPSVYSWDDCLAAVRCELAGFCSAFYQHYNIDHIDPGGDEFCKWKREEAGRTMPEFAQLVSDYRSGKRSIYHGPNDP